MEYSEKLTLHIPHYKWDGKLIPIDYLYFTQKIIGRLAEIGIDGCYSVAVTGYYKGRSYDEDLLTVYCKNDQVDKAVNIFRQSYGDTNDTMQQECFAYEYNDKMYVVGLEKI